MSDPDYKDEMGDLRDQVQQLGTCLDAVLKRIDELEAKKRASELHKLGQKATAPHEDAVYSEIAESTTTPTVVHNDSAVSPAGGDSHRSVQVTETHEGSDDGSGSVRKIQVTERVVTTKTHYAFSSPDADFEKAPPYEEGAYGTLHRTEVHGSKQHKSTAEVYQVNGTMAEPRIVGVRRPQPGKKHADQCWSASCTPCITVSLETSTYDPAGSGGNPALTRSPSSAALLMQGLHVKPDGDALLVESADADAPLAKSGLIHVGDRITAVDGRPVKSKDELAEALASGAPGDALTISLVPGEHATDFTAPDANARYVRALVSYDPSTDAALPGSGKEAGLGFQVGDILQVLAYDDDKYWQARKVPDGTRVGLIPSRKFEMSRRSAAVANGMASESGDGKKTNFLSFLPWRHKDDGSREETIYEEVGRLSPYGRRVLVLLGAPGVGRRTIKTQILSHDRKNFATVVPYTSRGPKSHEREGREYHFVSRDSMQKEINQGNYVEYGEYQKNLYGTSVQSVRDCIRTGRVCVLDCSPQAAHYLFTREFMPYVVFISPPSLDELKQLTQLQADPSARKTDDELKRTVEESGKLEAQHRHIIDLVLTNRSAETTFRRLWDAMEALKTDPQWVPAAWLPV